MAIFSALLRSLAKRTATQVRERGASAPEYALILTIMVSSTLVVLGQLEENTEEEVVATASEIGALPTIIGFVPVESTIPLPTVAPTQAPTTTSTTTTTTTTTTLAPPPAGDTIKVNAMGTTGGEKMKLKIDGVVVKTWNNLSDGAFNDYTYTHGSAVTIDRVEVEFDNNGTFNGNDKNIRVSGVDIEGTFHSTTGPGVLTTGVWTGNYCTSNEYFPQSDMLACNGSFRWVDRTVDLSCDWHEFTLAGDFELDEDGGKKFFYSPNGNGSEFSPGSATNAQCVVEVASPGVYKMVSNVSGPNGNDDSFYVSIDAGPGYLWDTARSAGFVDDNVSDRNNQDPVLVELVAGQYVVRVALREDGTKLHNLRLQYDGPPTATIVNVAQGRATSQSSTGYSGVSTRAVDGNTDGNYNNNSVTHTNTERHPWWQVDLGGQKDLESIKLYNRTDCCSTRLNNFYVFVADWDMSGTSLRDLRDDPSVYEHYESGTAGATYEISNVADGRYVMVVNRGRDQILSLAEVEVMGTP